MQGKRKRRNKGKEKTTADVVDMGATRKNEVQNFTGTGNKP